MLDVLPGNGQNCIWLSAEKHNREDGPARQGKTETLERGMSMAITDKQIEEALDNEFDGVDDFLMVQEILQLRTENTDLKAKLKERHEYIQNGMVDMALTKWRKAETENEKFRKTETSWVKEMNDMQVAFSKVSKGLHVINENKINVDLADKDEAYEALKAALKYIEDFQLKKTIKQLRDDIVERDKYIKEVEEQRDKLAKALNLPKFKDIIGLYADDEEPNG